MPEKNNSTLGKRFLEILFGVLLATRFCLSHAWPRPHRLLCSPHCQQKGKGERLGASSPCQEKPWWPSRRVGRNPGWPRFPHPLPTPALGPQQVFCPRKERAHENTHSCSELTTPTAGPARAWPQGCCGGQLQRAALPAGDSHSWTQDCSSPECCRQPRHSPALQGPGRHLPALQTLSPTNRLSPASTGSSHLHCPNPSCKGCLETCFCHTSGRANTARTRWGRNTCSSGTPPTSRGGQNPTTPQPGILLGCGEEGENKGFML